MNYKPTILLCHFSARYNYFHLAGSFPMGNVYPLLKDLHALAFVLSLDNTDAWPALCHLFEPYLTLCRGFSRFSLPLRVSKSSFHFKYASVSFQT